MCALKLVQAAFLPACYADIIPGIFHRKKAITLCAKFGLGLLSWL